MPTKEFEQNMNPFDRFANRFRNLPEVDLTQGQSITYSRTTTGRLMEIADANNMGNVHGGIIMRMVDETATIVAIKHSHRPSVTVRVERFNFLAPAFVGDVVSVHCELHYVGRTSMEVGVEVTAEDPVTQEIRKIASSYLIFVALDESRMPTQVPPLVAADDNEKAIIERALLRRAQRQKIDEEFKKLEKAQ
jgi:acyl-CoA hydrolase